MTALLSLAECREVADRLAETAETVIGLYALRTGRGRAFATGMKAGHWAAIVDPQITQGELLGFGEDVAGMAEILREIDGWTCVEVPMGVANELERCLIRQSGCKVRRAVDIYHVLHRPVVRMAHPAVRLLAAADAEFYAQHAAAFEDDPEELRRNVLEGPVAAAIVDGRVVAAIEANVRTHRYANICADVVAGERGKGLGTAAASVAVEAVQAMGLVPVWSTTEANLASRAVARKLGFEEVGRWVYLAPERG